MDKKMKKNNSSIHDDTCEDRRSFLRSSLGLALFTGVGYSMFSLSSMDKVIAADSSKTFEITKTDKEWRKLLSEKQFDVLRKHATERPGSSKLLYEKREGTYSCSACDLPAYSSKTKFDSGTGWPSFYDAIADSVGTKEDNTLFTKRTEVHCSRCGGHYGHIFKDGPKPTGLRHCINGVSLKFTAVV